MCRSVIVIHPGSLGDILLSIPALQRLRIIYPFHHLVCVAHEGASRFLMSCGLIDEWVSIEQADVGELFSGQIRSGGRLLTYLHQCDGFVAWLHDGDHSIEHAVRTCGVEWIRIGSPFHSKLTSKHQGDRFGEILGQLPIGSSNDVEVILPPELIEKGRAYLSRGTVPSDRRIVMIHPGSGSPLKCAPPDFLATVLTQLDADGYECTILEGPADHQSVEALCHRVGSRFHVVRGINLSTVAGILSQVGLYIGHDSGVTHLAGLIGVPTIALFGPTDPDRWAPRGRHVRILRGAFCTCSSWNDVQRCQARPCLAVALSELLDAIEILDENVHLSVKNTSSDTLSPPDPYDKVPR